MTKKIVEMMRFSKKSFSTDRNYTESSDDSNRGIEARKSATTENSVDKIYAEYHDVKNDSQSTNIILSTNRDSVGEKVEPESGELILPRENDIVDELEWKLGQDHQEN